MDVRIISIGTLSRNRLWNEFDAVRTPHATTTLVRARGDRAILVDPGLPAAVLGVRLNERTGLRPDQITAVPETHPSMASGILSCLA